jgi:hypothetical protein
MLPETKIDCETETKNHLSLSEKLLSHLQVLQGICCLTFLRYLLFVTRNHQKPNQMYGNLVTNILKDLDPRE